MMRFKLGCTLGYKMQAAASFVMNIEPATLERQTVVEESLTLSPEVPVERYVMPESGNRYVRFEAPAGELTLQYSGLVDIDPLTRDPTGVAEVPLRALPFETLPHTYPSRYCEADRLTRFATQIAGEQPAGHARVAAICNYIYERIQYLRGISDTHSSACDTLLERAGVCRDFAHLGISMCRALGIPARFVSAYAWGLVPPDFHAVFEAWLDGRWYLFDPTRQAVLDGLVRIGVGRDAAEVSFATIGGQVTPTTMQIQIEAADGSPPPTERTVLAISTADR
jgi:transglutaminase-like putative cysteine protease